MTEREQEILNHTIAILKEHIDPQTVYLFGSRSKDTHRTGSDFDIAVTGTKPHFDIQKNLEDDLENVIGLYQMDIIYLDDVEEDFRKLVLSQGKVIYEK